MASATLADDIRQKLGTLSPAERKVARVILAGYPAAGFETVAVLAERAAVSAPTVIRFVNRLGYQGFPDFQAVLREELDARNASPLSLYESAGFGRSEADEARDGGTPDDGTRRRTPEDAARTRRSCGAGARSSPGPSPPPSPNCPRTTSNTRYGSSRTGSAASPWPVAVSPTCSPSTSACT